MPHELKNQRFTLWFFIGLLIVVSLGGCSSMGKRNLAQHQSEGVGNMLTKESAVAIAQDFLKGESIPSEFKVNEFRVIEKVQQFEIYFQRVDAESRDPGEGLIIVDKKARKARWETVEVNEMKQIGTVLLNYLTVEVASELSMQQSRIFIPTKM